MLKEGILEQIRDERKQEFAVLDQPHVPDTVIRKVKLSVENEKNFVFEFNTKNFGYALVVACTDEKNLGWREVQALADCMKLCCIGEHMNNSTFSMYTLMLGLKYTSYHGPFVNNNRLVLILNPGSSNIPQTTPDTIRNFKLELDDDNDVILEASTDVNKFKICLSVPAENASMGHLDCIAFIEMVTYLEPGDPVDRDLFLFIFQKLRVEHNFIYLNAKSESDFRIMMFCSATKNDDPIERDVLEATKRVNARMIKEMEDQREQKSHQVPDCPYPDIQYVQQMRQGAQSEVYKAKRNSNEVVAVKVFTEEGSTNYQTYKRELKMLLKMPDHKNVVEVVDFFESPKPALVMQFIDGGDLDKYITEKGFVGLDEAKKMAMKIAEGIKHLHMNGVVHRDIKPANIVLESYDSEPNPVIIDLGIAGKNSEEDHNTDQQPVGTLYWMAPEMLENHQWSTKSDVYSFGIILWQMMTGETPFMHLVITDVQDLASKIVAGLRPDMSNLRTDDKEIVDLIERCLSADPKARPSMLEVLDTLRGRNPTSIFEHFDKNGDKSLSKAEFMLFLEKYAPDRMDDVIKIFKAIDLDKNGSICLDEFIQFWTTVESKGLESAFEFARQIRSTSGKYSVFMTG